MKSPMKTLKRIRTFWNPQGRKPLGSLYDFVAEEEECAKERAEGKTTDIIESPSVMVPQNFTYNTHTMVISTVTLCLSAANDLLFLMKECQNCLYASMSTWIGKPEDETVLNKIVLLKDLSFSESLKELGQVFDYFHENNPQALRQTVLTQLVPVHEEICELLRIIHGLTDMMQRNINDITPMMLKYSAKEYPSVSAFKQPSLTGRLPENASLLEYGPVYKKGIIVTARSASVVALTPLAVVSATSIAIPHRVSRFLHRLWRFLTCSPPKKTEVLRAPSTAGSGIAQVSSKDECRYEIEADSDKASNKLNSPLRFLPESELKPAIPVEFPSVSLAPSSGTTPNLSFEVKRNDGEEELPLLQYMSEVGSILGNILPVHPNNPSTSKFFQIAPRTPSKSRREATILSRPAKKRFQGNLESIMEESHLETTVTGDEDMSILHESYEIAKPMSSTCEISRNGSNTSPFEYDSCSFPVHPLMHTTRGLKELKLLLAEIFKIIRDAESQLCSLRHECLRSDPANCTAFCDLFRILKEKAMLLEIIEDYEIYYEEEVTVTAGLMDVFSEGLKSMELFRKFSNMITMDKELLQRIFKTVFTEEEIIELLPSAGSWSDSRSLMNLNGSGCKMLEIGHGLPMSSTFKEIKLKCHHAANQLSPTNSSSIDVTTSKSYN